MNLFFPKIRLIFITSCFALLSVACNNNSAQSTLASENADNTPEIENDSEVILENHGDLIYLVGKFEGNSFRKEVCRAGKGGYDRMPRLRRVFTLSQGHLILCQSKLALYSRAGEEVWTYNSTPGDATIETILFVEEGYLVLEYQGTTHPDADLIHLDHSGEEIYRRHYGQLVSRAYTGWHRGHRHSGFLTPDDDSDSVKIVYQFSTYGPRNARTVWGSYDASQLVISLSTTDNQFERGRSYDCSERANPCTYIKWGEVGTLTHP